MITRKTAGGVQWGTAPRPSDRKAVLICPRCGHESPVRGDWLLVAADDHVRVCCPDCRAQLTERPRQAGQGPGPKERARVR